MSVVLLDSEPSIETRSLSVSWMELQVPAATDNWGEVSWAEFEVPDPVGLLAMARAVFRRIFDRLFGGVN